MNQRFVVILTGNDPDGTVSDLQELVPEATVVSRDGEKLVVDCPIYCEGLLVGYFEDEGHVISRNRTYTVSREQSGGKD